MSDKKLNRYVRKIQSSFEEFDRNMIRYVGKTSSVERKLIQRLKFISKNFRLIHRKSNVLVGIYYSNKYLSSDPKDLNFLDKILQNEINKYINHISTKLNKRLDTISFIKGFDEREIINFSFNELSKRGAINVDGLTNIWNTL